MGKFDFLYKTKKLICLLFLLVTEAHADGRFGSAFQSSNPMAQINDVYAWMSNFSVNLAMTVSPLDDGTRSFGPSVQYVFHVTSQKKLPGLSAPEPGVETKIICQFASNTSVQCWVTDESGVKAYLSGDPTSTSGVFSADGKVRLFAGRRSDPFFFNLQGFRDAATLMRNFIPSASDFDGCPRGVDTARTDTVRKALSQDPRMAPMAPCTADNKDCFSALNVMAIVLQIDRSVFNLGTNSFISVWASTHAGQ